MTSEETIDNFQKPILVITEWTKAGGKKRVTFKEDSPCLAYSDEGDKLNSAAVGQLSAGMNPDPQGPDDGVNQFSHQSIGSKKVGKRRIRSISWKNAETRVRKPLKSRPHTMPVVKKSCGPQEDFALKTSHSHPEFRHAQPKPKAKRLARRSRSEPVSITADADPPNRIIKSTAKQQKGNEELKPNQPQQLVTAPTNDSEQTKEGNPEPVHGKTNQTTEVENTEQCRPEPVDQQTVDVIQNQLLMQEENGTNMAKSAATETDTSVDSVDMPMPYVERSSNEAKLIGEFMSLFQKQAPPGQKTRNLESVPEPPQLQGVKPRKVKLSRLPKIIPRTARNCKQLVTGTSCTSYNEGTVQSDESLKHEKEKPTYRDNNQEYFFSEMKPANMDSPDSSRLLNLSQTFSIKDSYPLTQNSCKPSDKKGETKNPGAIYRDMMDKTSKAYQDRYLKSQQMMSSVLHQIVNQKMCTSRFENAKGMTAYYNLHKALQNTQQNNYVWMLPSIDVPSSSPMASPKSLIPCFSSAKSEPSYRKLGTIRSQNPLQKTAEPPKVVVLPHPLAQLQLQLNSLSCVVGHPIPSTPLTWTGKACRPSPSRVAEVRERIARRQISKRGYRYVHIPT